MSPLIDPRGWWRWAFNHVSKTTAERRRQWTLDYIMERRKMRLRYIPLHKKRLEKGGLRGGDAATMEKLERKLSVDDILFFRALAAAELRLDMAVRVMVMLLKLIYAQVRQKETSRPRKILGWLWNKVQPQPEQEVVDANRPAWQIGEDQKEAFYEALGYSHTEKEPTGPPHV